jgi:phosphatidylserine/phosphatidylglycerophosphate/cardiolipin synthase-like enzyme
MPQSVVGELAAAGVPVWLDGRHAAAHNKVLIIDAALPGATTVTGSYNFTVAAQKRNAENVVIFRDNPAVAQTYRDNFRRLQARSQRWSPAAG